MTWEAGVTLLVVASILIALARNAAGPDVILMGAAGLLMTLNLASDKFPSPDAIAGGFGNEGLLTVGVLFVVAAGLTETGAMAMVTERVLGRPRSATDAQLRLMAPVIGFSAFLNNTPVVAMFIPVVNEWCR